LKTNTARLWILAAAAIIAAGCGGSTATTSSVTSPKASNSPSGKPPVPGPGGVYLGAWVNPERRGTHGVPGSQELVQLPQFDSLAGRKMAILGVYAKWTEPAPLQTLNAISSQYGAIPLLSWACGDKNANVAAGADDQLITGYAQALRSYGKPLFLRWYWEMNLRTHPQCIDSPSSYVAAWRHIWTIFHDQHADNVAFVWCPSANKSPYAANFADYYPGNGYVDWIAGDAFSQPYQGSPNFSTLWRPFYDWARTTKPAAPIMVAETGSGVAATGDQKGQIQATYLDSALNAIANNGPLRAIKAFVYFDGSGPNGSWDLEGSQGFNAFRAIGRAFTFRQPSG
jgi:hypothetical protein